MPERIVGLGAGGHAKVVLDLLDSLGGYEPIGLLDPDPAGDAVLGVSVLGGDELLPHLAADGVRLAFVGVGSTGDASLRVRLFELAKTHGLTLVTAVHPAATVSASAKLAEGTTVMAGAIVNADARLGANVIVNTGAIVEHDCVIGDHAHLSPRAVLAGGVRVGRLVHIGLGAVVREGVTIGEQAVVGAGAVVVGEVPARATVAGIPARPI